MRLYPPPPPTHPHLSWDSFDLKGQFTLQCFDVMYLHQASVFTPILKKSFYHHVYSCLLWEYYYLVNITSLLIITHPKIKQQKKSNMWLYCTGSTIILTELRCVTPAKCWAWSDSHDVVSKQLWQKHTWILKHDNRDFVFWKPAYSHSRVWTRSYQAGALLRAEPAWTHLKLQGHKETCLRPSMSCTQKSECDMIHIQQMDATFHNLL